jgi:hypothetical protein
MHTQEALCILHGQTPGIPWTGVTAPIPAFSSTDVGVLVEIQAGILNTSIQSLKAARKVHWGTSNHADCVGKIISVDPRVNGVVRLDSGSEFENPARVTYEDLWDNIPTRVCWPGAANMKLAEEHLAEAIYCRKLDLWFNQQAETIAQAQVAAVPWPSNGQKKKALPMVQFAMARALKTGLNLAAIEDVAHAVITAIQACGLGSDTAKAAAELAARAAASHTIQTARADLTQCRPSADSFLSNWAAFEATVPPNDGHVKQLNALVSCSEQCHRKFWCAAQQLQAALRRMAAMLHSTSRSQVLAFPLSNSRTGSACFELVAFWFLR